MKKRKGSRWTKKQEGAMLNAAEQIEATVIVFAMIIGIIAAIAFLISVLYSYREARIIAVLSIIFSVGGFYVYTIPIRIRHRKIASQDDNIIKEQKPKRVDKNEAKRSILYKYARRNHDTRMAKIFERLDQGHQDSTYTTREKTVISIDVPPVKEPGELGKANGVATRSLARTLEAKRHKEEFLASTRRRKEAKKGEEE